MSVVWVKRSVTHHINLERNLVSGLEQLPLIVFTAEQVTFHCSPMASNVSLIMRGVAMERVALSFLFKGNRNYIHGTDIYNEITNAICSRRSVRDINVLRMKMRKLVRKQCHLLLGHSGEKLKVPDDSPADILISTAGGDIHGYLLETGRDINSRYAFDEEAIRSRCSLNHDSVSVSGLSTYTAIEVGVVMTKLLHRKLFPDVQGKWLFTQLEMNRLFSPEDSSRLVIKFTHNFNYALTKSSIHSGTSELGRIYFSLV